MRLHLFLLFIGITIVLSHSQQATSFQEWHILPRLLVLACEQERETIQKVLRNIEQSKWTQSELEKWVEEWSRPLGFLLKKERGVILLISSKMLQENEYYHRHQLLSLLHQTLTTGQAVNLNDLPNNVRSALIQSLEQGSAFRFRGFEKLIASASYLMIEGQIMIKINCSDQTFGLVWGDLFSYPERWGKVQFPEISKSSASSKVPSDKPSRQVSSSLLLLHTSAFTQKELSEALLQMSAFWKEAIEQLANAYKRQVQELHNLLESRLEQVLGVPANVPLPLEQLPAPLYQDVVRALQSSIPDRKPSSITVTIRPVVQIAVRTPRGTTEVTSWGLDDQVTPIVQIEYP